MIPQIEISRRAYDRILGGILWIYSNEIKSRGLQLEPGTWCQFHFQNRVVAQGYFNKHSLIAGRVVSTDPNASAEDILSQKITEAFARRSYFKVKDSFRLIFSEGDFIPGLILDWFGKKGGGTLILQSNTAGVDKLLPTLKKIIPPLFEKTFGVEKVSFVVRADSGIRALEGIENFSEVVQGKEDKLKDDSFSSRGVLYAANFVDGQKTGFFLDHGDNRDMMTDIIQRRKYKKVLDLFCYSGGWGLKALVNGASHVTFVDVSKPALELVEKGAKLNELKAAQYKIEASDVFKFLEEDENTYDLVISDPPAFIKSKKDLHQGRMGYEKLNRAAWKRLKVGGTLIASSCSYHMNPLEFLDSLQTAISREGGIAHVVGLGTQAKDHPILLSMPETHYLKTVALEKLN
ncbi:MAG: class I SAM-dependent rRNA methyltransferase [Elusimicrobiota bacterium]